MGSSDDIVSEATPPAGNPALDEANRRLRAFQDGIPHLAWTTRPDGSIDFVNARWREYTGRDLEGMRDWRWLDLIHPDDRERHEREWRRAIETGSRYEESLRIRGSNGTYRWHALRDWPARDADGSIVQWFGTATDVDDQRHREEQIRQVNRDLDDFTAVASHDLQEPLRMVSSHLELLARKAAGRLDERDREHLDFAVDGVRRMQALISSLLRLAHVGHDELRLADVAVEAALAEAGANIALLAAETGGAISHERLPTVRADRASLVELLQNLLVNGFKYHREGVPPRIHVSAVRASGCWELAVRDNGVGIDPRDQRRIFEVFQRAGEPTRSRGSGLGLAVCKRIVERHHGRIWVESAPGVGSTFRFTLDGCGP